MKEKLVSKKTIYKGKILDLIVKEVTMPDGRKATREIIEHGGVIAVIPVTHDNKIVMVKQYRLTAETVTLEVPAGRMDPGETPLLAAKRELREETGYAAKKFEKWISFYPAIGYSNEKIHLFTARDLTMKTIDPDEDELIEVEYLTLEEAVQKIESGEIMDSKSILALLYAAYHKLI